MHKRIPEHFIQDLLCRINIVELIAKRMSLKRRGSNYLGLCPFHQEKSPSFSVSESKQFYHCFGCGAHGNAVGFLMEYDNLDFPEAIKELAQSAGMTVPYEEEKPQAVKKPLLNELYEILKQASQLYSLQLRHHPEAKEAVAYLKSRGLKGETAKRFGMGYAPDAWQFISEHLAGPVQRFDEAGLLVKNENGRYYDRFRARIMFPIRDKRGRIIAFGGRSLNEHHLPKYLNSPETPVFHKGRELYGLYEAKTLHRDFKMMLVVEGYMDVAMLFQHGITYAVATLGTAIGNEHLKALFRESKKVVFAFDGDRAGREAAWRALNVALPFLDGEREVNFLFLPEGEDPDSCIQKIGKDAFLAEIEKALPLQDFLWQTLSDGLYLDKLEGRAKLVTLMMPYLRKIPQSPYLDLIIKKLAKESGLDEEGLLRELESEGKPAMHQTTSQAEAVLSPLQKAFAIVLQRPRLVFDIEPQALAPLSQRGIEGLKELIETIQKAKLSATSMVLQAYHGHRYSRRFAELANHPCVDDMRDPLSQLQAIFEGFTRTLKNDRLSFLIERSKSAELTQAEKLELKTLLLNLKRRG